MTVARLDEFSSTMLCGIYDRTISPLQIILNAVMGKEGRKPGKHTRNPDSVSSLPSRLVALPLNIIPG